MLINVDSMIFEMLSTMKNNFSGTADQRFKQAKKLLLDSIAETIVLAVTQSAPAMVESKCTT